jgi:hypothetical protein
VQVSRKTSQKPTTDKPQSTSPPLKGYTPRTFDSPAEFVLSHTYITLKAGSNSATITATSKNGESLYWSSSGAHQWVTANPELLENFLVVVVFNSNNTNGNSTSFHIESSPNAQPAAYGFSIFATDQKTNNTVTKHISIRIE